MTFNNIGAYRNTAIATIFSLIFLALSILFDLDLFERFVSLLHKAEDFDVDEVIIAGSIIITGLMFDYKRESEKQRQELELKRLQALKATMSTVHDVVNNFLNNIHLFIFEAKKTGTLTPESIDSLERLMHKTASELRQMSEVQSVQEVEVVKGIIGIDYKDKSSDEAATK